MSEMREAKFRGGGKSEGGRMSEMSEAKLRGGGKSEDG